MLSSSKGPYDTSYGAKASVASSADTSSTSHLPRSNELNTTELSTPTDLTSLEAVQSNASTDHLKYVGASNFGHPTGGRRSQGFNDPENIEITRLRQKFDLDWAEIAAQINANRKKNGVQGLPITANAVFGRYKRNAPYIVTNSGKEYKPTTKDKENSKTGYFAQCQPVIGFDDNEDSLLRQAYVDVKDEFWTLVSKKVYKRGGKLHDPDLCSRRYSSIKA